VSRAPYLELGAIVVAAGSATRFGGEDKVFALLDGRPVLEHTLRLFAAERDVSALVVVLAEGSLQAGAALVASLGLRDVTLCVGGATRRDSVLAGLRALDRDIELVAIHDAARPLATQALLRRVVTAAREHGAAVPATALPDTLGRVDDDGALSASVERAGVVACQTPQVARREWLDTALAAAPSATDEGSALLAAGFPVVTVPGERHNFKLTWPNDLRLAEAWLALHVARA
jgi:2-C-methyl-D-erythritol 4-phosphate cytidylyltransferase